MFGRVSAGVGLPITLRQHPVWLLCWLLGWLVLPVSLAWASPDEDADLSSASPEAPPRFVEMRRSADVYAKPSSRPRHRRGMVARGARFAVLEESRGKGCEGRWLRIETNSWVCSRVTRRATTPPAPETADADPDPSHDDDVLPRDYIVTRDAAVYDSLDQAARARADDEQKTIRGLGGFVKGRSVRRHGKRFVETPHGWVEASDAESVTPSPFHGTVLTAQDRGKRLAFVRVARPRLYDADGRRLRERGPERQTFLGQLDEPIERRGRTLYRFTQEHYLESDDLSFIDWAERPEGVGEDERWIDVSLSQQMLVAYRGDTPVRATLVSTARTATTPGEYRIEKKRVTGRLRAKPEYNTQWDVSVPWVMTLEGRLAMHTVYWHENFGKPFSQGCVNLAPIDARWLWDWTEPALPPGWLNIESHDDRPGTFVRIRR